MEAHVEAIAPTMSSMASVAAEGTGTECSEVGQQLSNGGSGDTDGDSPGDSNALVVFSYANPFHDALRSDSRRFTLCDVDVVIRQAWKPDTRGGTALGFGASVYDCSFILAYYLSQHENEVANKTVVELGCGPGLAAIGAALAGAAYTIATDGDEESVSLAEANLRTNLSSASSSRSSSNSSSSSKEHQSFVTTKLMWGDQGDLDRVGSLLEEFTGRSMGASLSLPYGQQADVILAADVAALPYREAYAELVSTLKALCRPGGLVLLAYQVKLSIQSTSRLTSFPGSSHRRSLSSSSSFAIYLS
jgi:predicted nicotinamide N-methyase